MANIGDVVWVQEYKQPKSYKRGDKTIRPKAVLAATRLAVITSGQYESNGRISNFWYWEYMNENTGFPTGEKAHGYDNAAPYYFMPAPEYKTVTMVVKREQKKAA